MKRTISIFVFFVPIVIWGQGFIEMDTIYAPEALVNLIPKTIRITTSVDFNGDGKKDYICQSEFLQEPQNHCMEYWVTSKFEIVKEKLEYIEDYNFLRFVNIDSDPEPEIYSAFGWPEGIDYCFIDQDLKTREDSVLVYFSPVIIDKGKFYWGYAWDIEDLMLNFENDQIQLYCTTDHDVIRDGEEVTFPAWQRLFPVICFLGKSTQPDVKVEEVRSLSWMGLNEIRSKTLTPKE